MPAVDLGTDWASATAGARDKIGQDVGAYGALIAQFADRVLDIGGQFGINVALNPHS